MEKNQLPERFLHPSREYSPAPLWFWYGKLDGKELCRQIDEMVDKGVYNAFMHARAYLVTQYLEDDWWKAVDQVVSHSSEKGFHPWIYDEYAWPSGTAGSTFQYSDQKPSRVLAEGKRNMAKGLRWRYVSAQDAEQLNEILRNESENPVAVVSMEIDQKGNVKDDSLKTVSGRFDFPESFFGAGRSIMVFYQSVIPTAVDYLSKEAIRSFLRYTHEEYKKRYGKYFGSLIPGVFFDEIFNAADQIVWTDGFEKEFFSRKDYDILQYLPLLVLESSDGIHRQVRKDYHRIVAELYEEAFFQQIGEWCERNHLQLTGHTEEDILKHPLRQGDYFLTMKHLCIPGGDCHDYRYRYPRTITPVESKGAVSVGRLYGRRRMMSEAMGGAGWATPLQSFKRGINVLAAMGVNFFVLHGFYSEIDHQGSQADWPASFFLQNTYWKHFKVFADYISRICFMGTIGKPICKVALLYPINLIYERFCGGKVTEEGKVIGDHYHKALNLLLEHQIDADLIDEDSIIHAEIQDGKLTAGSEAFELILVPDAEGIQEQTLLKLHQFEKNGGHILFYRCGVCSDLSGSFDGASLVTNPDEKLIQMVEQKIQIGFKIIKGDNRGIFVSHRIYEDRDYYLIVNSEDRKKEFTALVSGKGIPVGYDPETGERFTLEATPQPDGKVQISIELEEDEAFYLVFETEQASLPLREDYKKARLIPIHDGWRIIPFAEGDRFPDEKKETQLELPVARFRSNLSPEWKKIRIQNKKEESGCCGKLLSRWQASWITRRPTWSDDSCEKSLFFRKRLELSGEVKKAKICVAAVNEFELYVNGRKACEGAGWRSPGEYDITKILKQGTNLLAVWVKNKTPIPGRNVLEAESFDPESLTSLLLEGYVETDKERISVRSDSSWITSSVWQKDWEYPSCTPETSAVKINVKDIAYPWERENPMQWQFAWERGTPPLQPWGQLPLFGGNVEFPVRMTYQFEIPIGTKRIFFPSVKGSFDCKLDQNEITRDDWIEGTYEIENSGKKHLFEISVCGEDFGDGLQKSLKIAMGQVETSLGDWRDLGLPYYSGSMAYQTSFVVEKASKSRCMLELGNVHFYAEVWVNGKPAGVRLWKPYQVDLTDFIRPGKNELTVVVSNLFANQMRCSLLDEGQALGWNRYWYEDNIDRDAQNLVSGLLGPVNLRIFEGSDEQ